MNTSHVTHLIVCASACLQTNPRSSFDWRTVRVRIERASRSLNELQALADQFDLVVAKAPTADAAYGLIEANEQFQRIPVKGMSTGVTMRHAEYYKLGEFLKSRLSDRNVSAEDYVAYAHFVDYFREPGLPKPSIIKREPITIRSNGRVYQTTLDTYADDVPKQRRVAELYRKAAELNPRDPAVLLYQAKRKGLSADEQAEGILAAWSYGGAQTHRLWCLQDLRKVATLRLTPKMKAKVQEILSPQ